MAEAASFSLPFSFRREQRWLCHHILQTVGEDLWNVFLKKATGQWLYFHGQNPTDHLCSREVRMCSRTAVLHASCVQSCRRRPSKDCAAEDEAKAFRARNPMKSPPVRQRLCARNTSSKLVYFVLAEASSLHNVALCSSKLIKGDQLFTK